MTARSPAPSPLAVRSLPPDMTVHAEGAGKHECAADWSLPHRTRPYTQVWLITGGSGWLKVGERRLTLSSGVVAIIPPDVPQWGRHRPHDPLRCCVLHASVRVLGAVVTDPLAALPVLFRPRPEAWNRLLGAADVVCRELAAHATAGLDAAVACRQVPVPVGEPPAGDLVSRLAANAALSDLVVLLWREAAAQGALDQPLTSEPTSRTPNRDAARIAAVRDYVAWHFWERVTLADLAAAARLSRPHLSTLFRRATGMAPFEYLHRYRMRQARDLLETTDLTIAEVGATVGVPDPFYFSRSFKRSEGIPPAVFRETRRRGHGP